MKKSFQKKLSLNKSTVSNIGREDMNKLYGGSYAKPVCVLEEEPTTWANISRCCGTPTGEEGAVLLNVEMAEIDTL